MKKLMLGMLMISSQQIATAQFIISGTVRSKEPESPVANATVELNDAAVAITKEDGSFQVTVSKKGLYTIRITAVGYAAWKQQITIADKETTFAVLLNNQTLFLQPVEIMAIRASDRMPFAKTNLNKTEIEKMNTGVDLPFIINQTPSVVVNSDAGNGIGYTGLRIRGSDATRINMTLNGIPYNDAESQGLFFVNLPDFSSSVNSIQIQRGVGTSSNGAGAFGATLNLSTNEFIEKPYTELNNGYGSFNSLRHTLKAGTGLIAKHFTVDTRISLINSNGFIDRASTNLRSAYLSAAYINPKTSIRFNMFGGKEKTYQAWNGIPEAKLKGNDSLLMIHYQNNAGSLYKTKEDSINLFSANNRTYNSFLYNNQTDNYRQNHYQFFVNHQFTKEWSMNTSFFVTRGLGYYEEQKIKETLSDYGLNNPAESNLVRRLWLNNWFYGTVFSVQYKKEKHQLSVGGTATNYNGKHYGEIIQSEIVVPENYRWYDLTASKQDFSTYTKYQFRITPRWEAFADLQYRNVNYRINGFRKNPTIKFSNQFKFINPKIGISYANSSGLSGFASFSVGNKEPNRDDFEANTNQQPTHETLYDVELNAEYRQKKFSAAITAYYMYYKNQLILTGKINDVGAYARINIPNSYRAGVELQGTAKPSAWFNASANLTLSQNRVLNFTEYTDDYDNGGQKQNFFTSSTLSFSPAVIAGATINFIPVKHGEIRLLNKYVSRQYLDNTGNKARSINPFLVNDLAVSYAVKTKLVKEIIFNLQLSNILNRKYEANGYTYNYIYGAQTIVENFYYPMAGVNFMIGMNVKF
jgi:iron complex outermembrane recepter protein